MFDIHKNPIARALPYTWATLPAVGTPGRMAWCTNFGTKGTLLVDDGTRWKPCGISSLASRDTALGATANVETLALQYLIPANMWALKDRIRLIGSLIKSGTTDSFTIKIRIGTTGVLATDTSIVSVNILAAANRGGSVNLDIRLETATTVLLLGANSAPNPSYPNAVNAAIDPAVTISSAVANALYISISIQSSGASNTVDISDALLQYISGGN